MIIPGKLLEILIGGACLVTTDKGTVQLAEKYWLFPFPTAIEYLQHYLKGTGQNKKVDIKSLFLDDPCLQRKVECAVAKALGDQPLRGSGRIRLDQGDFSKSTKAQNWRYAIGGFEMDWKVIRRDLTRRSAVVEISFQDEYRWRPDDPSLIDRCVHKAADNLRKQGAHNFRIIGRPVTMNVEF